MVIVIGPTPPGTGVIHAATLLRRFEVDVADQLAVRQAVDADVDDDRARLDHVAGDQARLAGRHHQDVGTPSVCWRDRGSATCRWSPSRCAAAASAPSACRRCCCGRPPPLLCLRSVPGCDRAWPCTRPACTARSPASPTTRLPTFWTWKPSTSFSTGDGLEHFGLAHLRRKRKLHQNAVDLRIGVRARGCGPAPRSSDAIGGHLVQLAAECRSRRRP